MAKYVNNALQILQSKKGNLYIQVTNDNGVLQDFISNLKPGMPIYLNNKEEERAQAVADGKITEERAQELADKIGFIKYDTSFKVEE